MAGSLLPWNEKYRPTKIEDVVQSDNIKQLLDENIRTGSMPHYIFYGPPGTGKTTTALCLARELFKEHYKERTIEFNASDDRGINSVRDKIYPRAKEYSESIESADGSMIPRFKIIILDEADTMTSEALDALRVVIEKHSNVTRFIFICNHYNKITDAIKSRCSVVNFKKINNGSVLGRIKYICVNEGLILDDTMIQILIEISGGDMRKVIVAAQRLKFEQDFKNHGSKPICDYTYRELRIISRGINKKIENKYITVADIYKAYSTINLNDAEQILLSTINSDRIQDVQLIAKDVVSTGYPIDSIMSQLNKIICLESHFNKLQAATIILYGAELFLRVKNSANEYLQLLEYLIFIRTFMKGNTNLKY